MIHLSRHRARSMSDIRREINMGGTRRPPHTLTIDMRTFPLLGFTTPLTDLPWVELI